MVITVDLSDPASVLPTLLTWLQWVRAKLEQSYALFRAKGLQLPEQLRMRAKNKFWAGHEDRDAVEHSGISIVVAATKHDAFRNQDAECQKVRARQIAHVSFAFAFAAMLVVAEWPPQKTTRALR